jgi:glutathionylspermidine synthase
MQEDINKFIKHTIVNLEGTLMKDDDELTLAVLTNLADTIDSYLEPLYLSVLSGKIEG